jgi:predicted amidophosphoribosyltransferase
MGAASRARGVCLAWGRDLADAMLGRACPGCGGRTARGRPVCAACDALVPRTGTVLCLLCMRDHAGSGGDEAAGSPAAGGGAAPGRGRGSGCPRHGSERLLLAGPPHEPPLDRIVHAFKYAGARELHGWIAGLLPEPPGLDTELRREYAVVPVPLHPARRAWRGFDQARLLAETAASRLGLFSACALERRRDHPPQARLDAARRRENVCGAFALTAEGARLLRARPVILVDDVATTGSTLLEAAEAVSEVSPAWILALTASHGGASTAPETPSAAWVATPPGV